ncbi:MAG: hypothetical protein LBN07_02550 [Christensenellaceae bacterium]|jgi:glycerophosphoryl diester phosphodiesterase|nr:hypothetical protein [Christensenellaceae bacterium]
MEFLINKYIANQGKTSKESVGCSLGAIKNAVKEEFGIFLPLHQIADGTIIVFENETLKHATGKDGYVNNIESKDALKQYKLQGSDETITPLEQVLKAANGKVPVILNIKHFNKIGSFEEELLKIIKEYKGDLAISSLNPYSLEWFKNHVPEILRGQIGGKLKQDELLQTMKRRKRRMLKKLKFNKISEPNFIIYEAQHLPNRAVRKNRVLPTLALGIKNQQEYMKKVKFCDNIIFEGFNPHI